MIILNTQERVKKTTHNDFKTKKQREKCLDRNLK